MSVNKNALIRYQVLDRCFSNRGRMFFWEDLLDECNKVLSEINPVSDGISRRQLFDDIRFMESNEGWSVELERNRYGRRVYYRYLDPDYSINKQLLNEAEAEQIRSALQIISRFSGTPQFEWVNEMIPMLESRFGLIERKKEVISFESNIDLKGIEFMTPLFNAINNERVLMIMYQDFKSEGPYEVILHPYFLKQYNSRWFILGLNETTKLIYTMALDRIESIEETNGLYIPSDIDWDDYFYDVIGVTRYAEAEVQEVILQFSSDAAPYVITKPLHPTQKHLLNEKGLEVTIKVIPNYELENVIMGFGEKVIVTFPEFLKERIAERLEKAKIQYD